MVSRTVSLAAVEPGESHQRGTQEANCGDVCGGMSQQDIEQGLESAVGHFLLSQSTVSDIAERLVFGVLIRVSDRWGKKRFSDIEQHQIRSCWGVRHECSTVRPRGKPYARGGGCACSIAPAALPRFCKNGAPQAKPR